MKKKKEERKMKKEGREDLKATHGYGIKISFLAFFLFYLFIFISSCSNPFFPEKKDNGGVVLTQIESVAVTVTAPVKGKTPEVTAVVADGGNYTASVEWDPEVASVFLGETVYTAVITLTADAGYTFTGGLTGTVTINEIDALPIVEISQDGKTANISHTFAMTLAKNVTNIEIESQPENLIYAHGDMLDLTGLVIKLNYSDTTTDNVALADFEEKGITTSPANGVTLSRPTHDSEIVSVTFGSHTAETDSLTVGKADPVVTFPTSAVLIYGQTLAEANLTGYDSTPSGSFAFATPATQPAVSQSGSSFPMAFTPDDTANYDFSGIAGWNSATGKVEQNVVITVNKADPVVAWPIIKAATWQTTLSQIWLPNNFAWKNPGTAFTNGTAYPMVYTPNDPANYNTLEQNITVVLAQNIGSGNSEMVWIPAGTFQMGQVGISDAMPVHQVTLTSGFYMGKYEVTQGQWDAVMTGATPSRNVTTTFGSSITRGVGANNPMYYVTWFDALEFCNRLSVLEGLTPVYTLTGITRNSTQNITAATVAVNLDNNGYRLPTEAQWEYACRAGTTTIWSYGDTENGDYMWYSANSGSQTRVVGTRISNAWGLFDMHGNIFEWCWDWFSSYTNDAKTDPSGVSSGSRRVIRGGDWSFSATYNRSAVRGGNGPSSRSSIIGFRLLRP